MILEDETVLKVTERELLHFGLQRGMDLDEESVVQLKGAAEKSNARAMAAGMLGRRALSKKEVKDRLAKKGASEEDAEETVEWLEDIGAVDDAAYGRMLARYYGSRGYGSARVRQELQKRGVPRELWEVAFEELPESEGAIETIVEKKLQGREPTVENIRKLSDMLLRRGFGWSEIRSVLRRYREDLEE